MKTLFAVILLMTHASRAAGPTIGLKNFKAIYFSMANATGVKPSNDIRLYNGSIETKFPRSGRVNEMSSSVLMAAKDLAGVFCKEFSKKYHAPSDTNAMFSELSQKLYGRELSIDEAKELSELVTKTSPRSNKPFLVCTAMLSCIEFLVQQ